MTARDLQIRLQKDLIELFKDRRYKTPDGKMEPVHVFRQNLPKRESEEAEDPFPTSPLFLTAAMSRTSGHHTKSPFFSHWHIRR